MDKILLVGKDNQVLFYMDKTVSDNGVTIDGVSISFNDKGIVIKLDKDYMPDRNKDNDVDAIIQNGELYFNVLEE